MNNPEYRKAYLSNLKVEVANNNKNFLANKSAPAVNQYIQNGGQVVSGYKSEVKREKNKK
jgi:hypothetical protein